MLPASVFAFAIVWLQSPPSSVPASTTAERLEALESLEKVGKRSPPREVRERLQAKLDALHHAGRFPGATLGVASAQDEPLALVVGVADRERNIAMKPGDRMLQGSVGKTYVAAVALQLVSEGKIALDSKIETWLGKEPWFARLPNAHDITVRMLMRHQSGLVRYEFKPEFTRELVAKPDRTWKPAELVAFLLDEKPPFAAGKGWDYSDTNYIVLGMIVERAGGAALNAQIENRLLKPLELRDTVPSDRRRISGLVQGYAGDRDPLGLPDRVLEAGEFVINPQFEWAGGGWASTAADLALWARALYGGEVLDAARKAEMLDAVDAPMLGRDAKYGLGVIVRPTATGTLLGHSGFFPGYVTEMWYSPERKAAVALQVNTSAFGAVGKPPAAVAQELLQIVSESGN